MKKFHYTNSSVNIPFIISGLLIFFLLSTNFAKEYQIFSYFNGNLALIQHFKTSSVNDISSWYIDIESHIPQQSTIEYLYTLNTWNSTSYQVLTSRCLSGQCACSYDVITRPKAQLNNRLQNYYSILSLRKQEGRYLTLDVCQDNFVPSNFIWYQSIYVKNTEWADTLWELAYLTDEGWRDSWQRGKTAYKQALRYRQVNDTQAAQQAFEIAVESFLLSDNTKASSYTSWSLTALGEIALEQGDLNTATLKFQESILVSPRDAGKAFHGLINTWYQQGLNADDIYQEFTKIRHKGEFNNPYLTSGASQAFLKFGELDLAWDLIYSAQKEMQEMPPVLEVQGLLHEMVGDMENAELAFQTALRRTSDEDHLALAKLADHLARIYQVQNDTPNVITHLELATQVNPKAAWYWYRLSMAYAKNGDIETAQISLKKAISLEPENNVFKQAYDTLQE